MCGFLPAGFLSGPGFLVTPYQWPGYAQRLVEVVDVDISPSIIPPLPDADSGESQKERQADEPVGSFAGNRGVDGPSYQVSRTGPASQSVVVLRRPEGRDDSRPEPQSFPEQDEPEHESLIHFVLARVWRGQDLIGEVRPLLHIKPPCLLPPEPTGVSFRGKKTVLYFGEREQRRRHATRMTRIRILSAGGT